MMPHINACLAAEVDRDKNFLDNMLTPMCITALQLSNFYHLNLLCD